MKIASIDIGTNTCNLLVAEYSAGNNPGFIHKEKQAITLINKDFHGNIISTESVEGLIRVLNNYKTTIDFYKPQHLVATATSGIRSAANRNEIVHAIQSSTGIKINVIDGQKEAELAWYGVKNAVKLDENPVLIIDIGGGSIEFIICNIKGIIWKESYNIGVARLISRFGFSDPLTNTDIQNIITVLDSETGELIKKCAEYKPNSIIGSSGSFETFASLIKHNCNEPYITENNASNTICIYEFEKIHKLLLGLNEQQRTVMPGMDIIRVKMIPVASVITLHFLNRLNVQNFIQSNYSIKEGLIFDYLSNNF